MWTESPQENWRLSQLATKVTLYLGSNTRLSAKDVFCSWKTTEILVFPLPKLTAFQGLLPPTTFSPSGTFFPLDWSLDLLECFFIYMFHEHHFWTITNCAKKKKSIWRFIAPWCWWKFLSHASSRFPQWFSGSNHLRKKYNAKPNVSVIEINFIDAWRFPPETVLFIVLNPFKKKKSCE